MRNLLLLIFLTFVGGAVFQTYKLGVFKKVTIEDGSRPSFKIIYKDFIGPYHKIGGVISEVETWCKSNQIPCERTFGEYIDDPTVVEHERLRSRGGCIVNEAPSTLPEPLRSTEVPARNYYVASFEGSPWIGPYKVYSQVMDLAEQQRVTIKDPVIEIYELFGHNQMRTTYLFPKN